MISKKKVNADVDHGWDGGFIHEYEKKRLSTVHFIKISQYDHTVK